MESTKKSEDLKFTIDARTIVQLGRDSIKNPTTALLELVKNSYDADATIVEVEINNNTIRIADNGNGMTPQQLKSNWLRIGYSEKRKNKLTGSSRRKTGEKGIGRLSTDRLGKNVILKTKSKESQATQLSIDWDRFDVDGKDLSEISIQMSTTGTISLPGSESGTGTEIIVQNLRQSWIRKDVEHVLIELTALVSPFSKLKDFQIIFRSELFPEFNGSIESSYYSAAELSIKAEYDGKSGMIDYTIVDKTEKKEKLTTDSIIWSQLSQRVVSSGMGFSSDLSCGPVAIEILFFLRTSNNPLLEEKGFSLKNMREFLDKNSGIKIYRDDVSVKPYGYNEEPTGDWLGLAQRKEREPAGVMRPTYRMSYSQLVGAISIGRDENPQLRDGASREGLVENNAFYDLRALTLSCVTLLEQYRHQSALKLAKREAKPLVEKVEEYKEDLGNLKENLESLKTEISSSGSGSGNESFERIQEIIKKTEAHEKSVEELLYNNRVLSGLATVGIASAVFGHETQTAISLFKTSVNAAVSSLSRKPEPNIEKAQGQLKTSLSYAKQVSAWGAFGMARVKKDKRTRRTVSVKNTVEGTIAEIEDAFTAVNIEIIKDLKEINTKAFVMDIESVVLNLLMNAYTACTQKSGDRKIRVNLREEKKDDRDGFILSVADSGPGVDGSVKEVIWEPLFTTKKDRTGKEEGTGLGLSIVRSTVEELGGSYSVDKDPTLGGANFKIWFPVAR